MFRLRGRAVLGLLLISLAGCSSAGTELTRSRDPSYAHIAFRHVTVPPRAVIVTHTHGEFGHRALVDAAAPVLPGLERAAAFVF